MQHANSTTATRLNFCWCGAMSRPNHKQSSQFLCFINQAQEPWCKMQGNNKYITLTVTWKDQLIKIGAVWQRITPIFDGNNNIKSKINSMVTGFSRLNHHVKPWCHLLYFAQQRIKHHNIQMLSAMCSWPLLQHMRPIVLSTHCSKIMFDL